ncbi:hypothetical protein [Intrasporangium sp. YIM S08009]|uniref:hypothetical protein n=1 Tax=Intrasporangium zincisolvens TaxID=3080018 RepID=UPI002B0604D0|nr:hypothetical protein [Intrasporangium sp. YIM S08009]
MSATDPSPSPAPASPATPGTPQRLTGALTLLEALVVVGFAGFFAYEIATGATSTVTTAVMSGLLILVFGVGLGLLARGWFRGRDWPRTPTLLWNALLLPVAWSLHDAGRTPVALGVAAVALVSIGAALATPMRRDADADHADDEDKED